MLLYVKIHKGAQSKTLNLPLSIGCCDWLFKAYLCTLKRTIEAANNKWEKETQIKKLTSTYALMLKNYKVVKSALQIQISNFLIFFVFSDSSGESLVFTLLYLSAAVIQIGILLKFANFLVSHLWRRGIDPDSAAIPYLTSLGDLLGGVLLSLAVYLESLLL